VETDIKGSKNSIGSRCTFFFFKLRGNRAAQKVRRKRSQGRKSVFRGAKGDD